MLPKCLEPPIRITQDWSDEVSEPVMKIKYIERYENNEVIIYFAFNPSRHLMV